MDQNELAIIKAHFPSFCKFVYPQYQFAPHLLEMANAFRMINNREIKRLIINLPPRMGKSLTTSHIFPAWYLINNPDHRIILAAYEASFAATFGKKARDLIKEYGHYWGIELDTLSKARDSWDLKSPHLGGMNTAGVGGSITGKGADVLIIDDPIKNAEESMSKTIKTKIWDWYRSTAYTRLEPDGAIILIQTRWAEDDLTGKVLEIADEENDDERWYKLIYPALDENGKSIWESRFSTRRMLQIKNDVGDFWWNALYMQDPKPREGGLFNTRNMIRCVSIDEPVIARCRAWDIAVTADTTEDPDYTVGILLERGISGKIYITDIQRFRGQPSTVEERILKCAFNDPVGTHIVIEQQPGGAGVIMKNYFERVLAGFPLHWMFPSRSKEERAMPLAVAIDKGLIHYFTAPWNDALFHEMESFIPNRSSHDDQVDALSMGYNFLGNFEKKGMDNLQKFVKLNASGGYV